MGSFFCVDYVYPQFVIQPCTSADKAFDEGSIRELTFCADPDWMAFEGIVNGRHTGITSDYVKLLSETIPYIFIALRFLKPNLFLLSRLITQLLRCLRRQ